MIIAEDTPYDVLLRKAVTSSDAVNELTKLKKVTETEYDKIKNFIATRDAQIIHKACEGIGANDELLITIMCQRTKSQLNHISRIYTTILQNASTKTLFEKIKSNTSGNYGRFLRTIILPRAEYYGTNS